MERFVVAAIAVVSFTSLLPAAEEVDFRLARKHFVIVPVLVEGRGPYEFVLDTGSTTSVVDRDLARDLGLETLQHTIVRTATGTERVPVARLGRIQLGSKSTETVLVLCSQLAGVRSLVPEVRGIIGFNVLSRFRYVIDYKRKRLLFDPAGPVDGARVSFDASGRSVVLVAAGVRLLLDTGASGVFLFDSDGLDIELNQRAVRSLSTNSGRRLAKSGWIRSLEIGGESFGRVPVTLVPRTGLEARADGLLPGTLFDAIYFDHGNNVIVLNPVSIPR